MFLPLIFFGCGEEQSSGDEVKKPDVQTYEGYDFEIVAGKSVGTISPETSVNELNTIFGDDNVISDSVYVGEGMMEPGFKVYPGSDAELQILQIPDNDRISSIYISKDNTPWQTQSGVTIGTTAREIERLNGRPFKLLGFGWDYSGTIVSWEGGNLEKDHKLATANNPGLFIRVYPDEDIPDAYMDELLGSDEIMSNHPGLQGMTLRVYELINVMNR